MRNLMYEGKTKDEKTIKIYDDGTCDGDFEFNTVFNRFEIFVNKKVSGILKEIKNLSTKKTSVDGNTMKVEITKDEYGVQVWTDKEKQDHVIDLENVSELKLLKQAIDDFLEGPDESKEATS